ncbi:MAG TPA: TraB/GumN family protein, partial [Candidatus Limiplasma sp.]|nr:TraB/GumN family protein [Candidatus Limiplasma sp.]
INTLAVYSTAAELGNVDVNTALSLGVEKQVQDYGQKAGKPFAYLETAMEQTDILEGFSDNLKKYLLQSECDTILNPSAVTGMDASISLWPGWWRQGNAAAFSDQYLRSYLEPGYETVCREYHTKLITSRNEAMTARLSKMLQEDGTFFVTVGLLHLVLPQDGIVARLQALGYTVEQIPMETGTTGEANP